MVPKPLRASRWKVIGELGISLNQYYYWQRHPKFRKIVRKLTDAYFADAIPEVILSLRNSALAGDVSAQSAFLKYFDQREEIEERTKMMDDLRKRLTQSDIDMLLIRIRDK